MKCKLRHIPVALFSASFFSWAKMITTLFTGLFMLALIHLQVTTFLLQPMITIMQS